MEKEEEKVKRKTTLSTYYFDEICVVQWEDMIPFDETFIIPCSFGWVTRDGVYIECQEGLTY